MNSGHGFLSNEILRENRRRSRHQAISGATGAPEKKGLNLYGCVVAGGAHRVIVCSLPHPADARQAPDVRSA